ncbi:MAG: hypothetical protein J2P36_02665 [Ktedonobacteraceae bacterium]|nr:hypothetical protein [Ktedonobacteraceae bacterium]
MSAITSYTSFGGKSEACSARFEIGSFTTSLNSIKTEVLLQLHTMNQQELRTTELSYIDRETGETRTVRILDEGAKTEEVFD